MIPVPYNQSVGYDEIDSLLETMSGSVAGVPSVGTVALAIEWQYVLYRHRRRRALPGPAAGPR